MSQITVTGHLYDSTGTPIANAPVKFTLSNLNGNTPYVNGTNIIVPSSVSTTTNSLGFFSIQIQGNDTITPAGTFYQVQYSNAPYVVSNYLLTGSGPIDLDSTAPLTIFPIPVGPLPTSILTGNNTFSGSNIFIGSLTASGNGSSGNVAVKAAVADSVQYVSINDGNDSNDGLSWGTAKLTIAAAITALNAGVTGGGTVHIAAGTYAGGITMPTGVAVIGSGKDSTQVTAPNGSAAFDFPNGTHFARVEDLWISVTHATSTGITMEGNVSLNLFTQFNTIRNVRIIGDRTVGEHGINCQGTSSIGDVSLNRFDSVEIAQIDIPVIQHFSEGDVWTDLNIVEYNEGNVANAIAFDATGAYDQHVQIRVTADNLTGSGNTAYYTNGQRNHVHVYCESARAVNQACVKDAGSQNMYLAISGLNSIPTASLTGNSGVFSNTATIPFYFVFPTGLSGGSAVLELADASGTVHAFFDNNGIYNYQDGSGHLGVLAVAGLTSSSTAWVLPNAGGNIVIDTASQTLTNKTLTAPVINEASGQVISWNGDTGISRGFAGGLYFGNGTSGDATGAILCKQARFSTSTNLMDIFFQNNNSVAIGSGASYGFYSTTGGVTLDTGVSRISAGLIGIGNGTQGDFSGAIKTTSPIINGTPTGTGIQTIVFARGTGSGNYTGTNTSLANVDAAHLTSGALTIPTGWKLCVWCSGTCFPTTGTANVNIALFDSFSSAVVTQILQTGTLNTTLGFNLVYEFNGDGNAHTYTLQASTTNASDAWNITNSALIGAPVMLFIMAPSN
jgi:hypothetical protein